jgi:uncharacterized SAM-binding protein YcdF (DUF218 family)
VRLKRHVRSARNRRRHLPAAALAALALLVILPAAGFLVFWLTLPGPARPGIFTDGAVILTGGTGRLGRGAEVLAAGRARRLLVSGVDPKVRASELREAMGLDPALFAGAVDLGFAAENTRANAAEVTAWAERHRLRSIRIITSDYHGPRALGEIRARLARSSLSPEVRLVVDGVPADPSPAQLAREYAKFLASRARIAVGR